MLSDTKKVKKRKFKDEKGHNHVIECSMGKWENIMLYCEKCELPYVLSHKQVEELEIF